MPPWGNGKKTLVPSGKDGIDALPVEVVEHILGFLPAHEAVRTSVLGRRWCHLWKSATGLRVTCIVHRSGYRESPEECELLKECQRIIDHLLDSREGAPLESFELSFCKFDDEANVVRRWVQRAIMCRVRVLKVNNTSRDSSWLDSQPLVSQYLTTLKIHSVDVGSKFVDFSSCPSLEHLELVDCFFCNAKKIVSPSVKRLTIKYGVLQRNSLVGTLICVPNLVSLRMEECHHHTAPMFQSMPLLQEEFIMFLSTDPVDFDDCEEDCYTCYGINNHDEANKCGLLEHLSEVENLNLVFIPRTFYKSVLHIQCPTFNKLKSLLLNDFWCIAPDYYALTCILKHSPVLQKLTLEHFSREGSQCKLRIKGICNPTKMSATISGHLKSVKIKCDVADERVFKLLKFLGTLGTCFSLDEIEILE